MKRGMALATFIIGIISVLCGTAATVLGAIGMSKKTESIYEAPELE